MCEEDLLEATCALEAIQGLTCEVPMRMFCREKEPWEASDGAVYMLRELSGPFVLLAFQEF